MSRTILKKQNKPMVSSKRISKLRENSQIIKCGARPQGVGSFNNRAYPVADFRPAQKLNSWALVVFRKINALSASVIEIEKATLVAKLRLVNRKLIEARQELSEVVMRALDLGEAGDDIADQVLEAMVEIGPVTLNRV